MFDHTLTEIEHSARTLFAQIRPALRQGAA
jgi:hypothetical protein